MSGPVFLLVLMDPDQASDLAIFVSDLQDANKKNFFFLCFSRITVLFECTFTSFFKDKQSERNHKTIGIKVFLTIFA